MVVTYVDGRRFGGEWLLPEFSRREVKGLSFCHEVMSLHLERMVLLLLLHKVRSELQYLLDTHTMFSYRRAFKIG